jgi:hypothetical protein
MPYMNILTWVPESRDAIIDRANKIGMEHEGIKVIGTWADLNGGRVFQLTEEATDPKLSIKANHTWNDLMKIEAVPVMDAGEFLKILRSLR